MIYVPMLLINKNPPGFGLAALPFPRRPDMGVCFNYEYLLIVKSWKSVDWLWNTAAGWGGWCGRCLRHPLLLIFVLKVIERWPSVAPNFESPFKKCTPPLLKIYLFERVAATTCHPFSSFIFCQRCAEKSLTLSNDTLKPQNVMKSSAKPLLGKKNQSFSFFFVVTSSKTQFVLRRGCKITR